MSREPVDPPSEAGKLPTGRVARTARVGGLVTDAKAMAAEMRERIGEELDYELEAQNQRRIERLVRGHPFISVPQVAIPGVAAAIDREADHSFG